MTQLLHEEGIKIITKAKTLWFSKKGTGTVLDIESEAAKFYLFTLRLIPVFPFFVINLVMGLMTIPLISIYWVSQLGMLPGTMVYVNAGKQLADIESLFGILSPEVIFSFALLGLFPLISKKLMDFYKSRKKRSEKME